MLFGRRVAIEFGRAGRAGRRVEGIDLSFDVRHTRAATPSKATIKAYNLADASVAALAEPDVVVRLFAGYGDARLIFVGTPVKGGVSTSREGADRLTSIELLDGGRAYQGGRLDLAFAVDVTWRDVFSAVVDAAGWSAPPASTLPPDVDAVTFGGGLVLHGPARDVLDRLADAVDARWFVRDGVAYVVARDGDTGEPAPLYSPRTGLIGAPTRTPEGDVEIRALLDPAMRPGRPYRVETAAGVADYVAREVVFEGSTKDRAFYVVIRGKIRN